MTSGDGTHIGFRNVVTKLILHKVQKPQSQKTVFYSRRKSKMKINVLDFSDTF